MIIVFITTIISFILESIISNFIGINNLILIPLFTLVSLIIIYPYFRSNNLSYLKICGLVGLFYDLVYTDTLIMNIMIFILIGYIITKLNYFLTFNIVNICIMIPITILVYRCVTYFILCIAGFINFNWENLFVSIYSSIFINIIYGLSVYMISSYFAKKYKIVKMD